MTDNQWEKLISIVTGEPQSEATCGFIIDSPWIPGWYGIPLIDYFSNDDIWFKANLSAVSAFPEAMFFPCFWSEYGMCTEPSAFGAKCTFRAEEFPYAGKIINTVEEIDMIEVPDPASDGLLPFMLNRLVKMQPHIEDVGYKIRFSVSRGPLNIASFMMGITELMLAMMTEPEKVKQLLRLITDFLKAWHSLQRSTFPSIDGIMMLDDIVGFIGEEDFLTFGYPYIKEIYDNAPVRIKFFHNDADFRVSVRHYPDMGVNIFNPGTQMTINEIKAVTSNRLTVVGNIPPRDVLACGSPNDVTESITELITNLKDRSRVILSCGGGMPPGVSTANIKAFIKSARY